MSAVSPTISGRSRPSRASSSPNGASSVSLLGTSISSPMPRVWPGPEDSRVDVMVLLELGDQVGPLVVGDTHEVGARSVDQRRNPAAGGGSQNDRLGCAIGLAGGGQGAGERGQVVAVHLERAP